MDTTELQVRRAASTLAAGGIVAYTTESVYGLGCDPNNHKAVTQLFALKRRSYDKGFILIADSWDKLEPWTKPVPHHARLAALTSWPGAKTWVFPAADDVPHWVTGRFPSVALRITNHPIASALCKQFGGPIISTSANIQGSSPARDIRTLEMIFPSGLDAIIVGEVGERLRPTPIFDVVSGECLREG